MKIELKELCDIKMGQSPDSSTYNSNGDGLPFYQGNADFGELYPTARIYCSQPIKVANRGDLLISVRAPIGAINLADQKCCIGRGLAAITPKQGISYAPYVFYLLLANQKSLNACGTGSTFKAITRKTLSDFLVNNVSYDNQFDISKKISNIDNIIAKRKQQLEKLDLFVKSQFIEMFVKHEFASLPFGDLCEFLRNGANIKQTKDAGGYPITRIETISNDVFNVNRLGYAGITDLQRYRAYLLQKGDILISHINSVAYLGRAVQYRCELETPVIHGMNLLCARLKSAVLPDYIEAFFRTKKAKDYISTITKKAVNQASITTTDLKKMDVPIPPIELQNKFARFVEQTDKSKLAIKRSLEKLETLKKALMQKYFG